MWSWFSDKYSLDISVDVHSHLLPGIDDGVKTTEEALTILTEFQKLGMRKAITTPHIYPDYYPNSEETILSKKDELVKACQSAGLKIEVDAAAEYFIDPSIIKKLKKKDQLLTFGDKYILAETSFMSKPLIFDEVIFELKAAGYKPIIAHPERYEYIELDWVKHLIQQDVYFHLSIPSLVGAYGSKPKKVAKEMLKKGLYKFAGSDIHRPSQLKVFKDALNTKIPLAELANNAL